MNECWLCNKIYDTKELYEMDSWDREVCCITYNKNDNTVEVCDPLEGNKTYEMDRFEEIYKEMGSQAVLLYK